MEALLFWDFFSILVLVVFREDFSPSNESKMILERLSISSSFDESVMFIGTSNWSSSEPTTSDRLPILLTVFYLSLTLPCFLRSGLFAVFYSYLTLLVFLEPNAPFENFLFISAYLLSSFSLSSLLLELSIYTACLSSSCYLTASLYFSYAPISSY